MAVSTSFAGTKLEALLSRSSSSAATTSSRASNGSCLVGSVRPIRSRRPQIQRGVRCEVTASSDTSAAAVQSVASNISALEQLKNSATGDTDRAVKSLIRLRESVSDHGDPTERVAFYFAEALHNRVSVLQSGKSFTTAYDTPCEDFTLSYKALNDACPYSKFAHLTANQAILEATERATKIHIVDFGIVQGVQWAALLQALATRSTGKPVSIRISGIPAPSLGDSPAASLFATGNRLREFAKLLELNFEFEPILTPITRCGTRALVAEASSLCTRIASCSGLITAMLANARFASMHFPSLLYMLRMPLQGFLFKSL